MAVAAKTKPFQLPHPYSGHAVIPEGVDPDSRDGRIAKVMPLLVRHANSFRESLKPRERGQFALDDVIQELWIELIDKDKYFDPSRSKYITYANMVAWQKLAEIRNRWHVVPGPRDTAAQLRSSDDEPKTEAIRQTTREHSSLDEQGIDVSSHDCDQLEDRESSANAKLMIKDAMKKIGNPLHAAVLCLSYGLNGSSPKTVTEIAASLKKTTAQIVLARKEAIREARNLFVQAGITYY